MSGAQHMQHTSAAVGCHSEWSKAEEYLQSSNDVAQVPGNDPKSKMVTSRSGGTPHFVRVVSPGQYVSDKYCLQWCSSQICSHTLVTAEVNRELELFLKWYFVASAQEPNITWLAHVGLPAGRGRKGGVPKRKRSRTPSVAPVPRPATSQLRSPLELAPTCWFPAHSSFTACRSFPHLPSAHTHSVFKPCVL